MLITVFLPVYTCIKNWNFYSVKIFTHNNNNNNNDDDDDDSSIIICSI